MLNSSHKFLSSISDLSKLFWCSIPARTHILCGGDDVAISYAAYRFAELMGVRFRSYGDVIPDVSSSSAPSDGSMSMRFPFRVSLLPTVHELATPVFNLRGLQPFHDFPEGPDWWNLS